MRNKDAFFCVTLSDERIKRNRMPSERMKRNVTHFLKRIPARCRLLLFVLILVECTLYIPGWGNSYSQHIYPAIAQTLGAFSQHIPFALGDLFIATALVWLVASPFYKRLVQKKSWKRIWLSEAEYLLWIYVWFYAAWGLNYAQPDFYARTGIARTAYAEADFRSFVACYVDSLNQAYTATAVTDKDSIVRTVARTYRHTRRLPGIHPLWQPHPRAKTMLFTPLASMVGVTGSMGPFFCEFTLNGNILPSYYPATYAHELAHYQGIAREAEANLYAYLACTRSDEPSVRFSGYLSILPHVLSNAAQLLGKDDYEQIRKSIRPEVIDLALYNQQYWEAQYNPFIGSLQKWLYELYLKGNRIASGRKNYSEVIGLLISVREHYRINPIKEI